MSKTVLTRRAALVALAAVIPSVAMAARRREEAGGVLVDVSPLRRNGDETDADYLAQTLPGYLRQSVGPGRSIRVRIDSVTYGPPGSNGQSNGNGAVDSIEGVGWIDGREAPLLCSVITTISLPDIGGYQAHQRQDTLARSFAQWLPRQVGV